MGAAFFYHLTRHPVEVTLRTLLEKSRQQGWRVAVRGRTDEALDRLDAQLWLGPEDGFLPHGRAGGPHDADQPILLTTGAAAPNRPDCVISVEGAGVAAPEVTALSRVMILFDGHDEAAKQTAREQWRSLTDAGVEAKYWSEESGRWEMKAQSGG
ncbi:DNA polymerase III chi subunit [Roseibacterium elongatum DSM 19469]|uniref:DNA polymerase III chi subunit n=1 Tax=Roseicyclus elongatus DSM 19469 TaxID=1294273 RepID=W8SSI8_9RHOB|nr:DNA polymerase III subunit chi [Roseibacterium elongatum]AHM05465.1 DNA polymerase III chi subunit [Roseibacterium elongatum DSM 19469]